MSRFKYFIILFFCISALNGFAQDPVDSDGTTEPSTSVNKSDKKGKKDKADKKDKKGKKDRKKRDSTGTNLNVGQEQVSIVEMKPAYIIGVGAAFGDTLVYITEVNKVENARFTKKYNFLDRRMEYSYQFKNFLEQTLGLEDRTCSIVFYDKLKKALKARRKLMERYLKASDVSLQSVNKETFSFKPLEYNEEE